MYFIYDDQYLKHENGISHPENPDRLRYIKKTADGLAEKGIIEYIAPSAAAQDQIAMVHDLSYIKKIEELSRKGGLSFLDMDTGVNQYTYSCALLAAGGFFDGIDLIFTDKSRYRKFFLACRPPGHHAFPSRGSGFCIFNNAALGAKYARYEHGIEKIAIIDFDAHHGNGTQDIFYEDDSVYYISFHQYPHYPGSGDLNETGYGKGEGFNLNFPFVPGTKEPDYLLALTDIILPVLEKFEPGLIIISAGYDSHFADNMSSLGLLKGSYRKIMNALSYISNKYCYGRMAIVLEGGYEYISTAESVASTIEASTEDITKSGIKTLKDIKSYFEMDDDYRKKRIKNDMILAGAAMITGLEW